MQLCNLVHMTTRDQVTSFFELNVPKTWFVGGPTIELDDDEVLCVGTLPDDRSSDDFRRRLRRGASRSPPKLSPASAARCPGAW